MRLLKSKLSELDSKKFIIISTLLCAVLVIVFFTFNTEDKAKEKKMEIKKDTIEVNQVNKDNHSDLAIKDEYSFINQKDRITNVTQEKEASDLKTKVAELPKVKHKETSSTTNSTKQDKSTSTQATITTTETSTASKPITTTPKSDSKPTTTTNEADVQPKQETTPEETQPIQQPKQQQTVEPSSLNKDSILNYLSSNGY